MKALSIRQPWAYAILFAGKRVENRSWATRYRGRILIHASATRGDAQWWASALPAIAAAAPTPSLVPKWEMPMGALVAWAYLVECRRDWTPPGQERWCEPAAWHWLLEDVRIFAEPVPYKGARGLFEVAETKELLDAMADAGRAHMPPAARSLPNLWAGHGRRRT